MASSLWDAFMGCDRRGKTHLKNMESFVLENMATWDCLMETRGLKSGLIETQNWSNTNFVLVDVDFPQEYSFEAARAVGFYEQIDTVCSHNFH